MGTSKSYSGSGGKVGKAIRDDIGAWLESVPSTSNEPPRTADSASPLDQPFRNVIGLLRPRRGGSGDGPGGGGGGTGGASSSGRQGGGPKRSASRSAATAGRAAAAAYAYRTGNAAALQSMGLDLGELRALGSPTQVARRIVEFVCGPRGDSTIEDSEQRLIAAEIAEWVVSQEAEGFTASPEDIAKHAIANIVVDTLLTETGELLGSSSNAAIAEDQIREAAENWVGSQATIKINGATEADFSKAIEAGIESLRRILRGTS